MRFGVSCPETSETRRALKGNQIIYLSISCSLCGRLSKLVHPLEFKENVLFSEVLAVFWSTCRFLTGVKCIFRVKIQMFFHWEKVKEKIFLDKLSNYCLDITCSSFVQLKYILQGFVSRFESKVRNLH